MSGNYRDVIPQLDPQFQEDLSDVKCGNPQCKDPGCSSVLALIPACHPGAGIEAEYHKGDGTLRTACAHCRRPVVTFQVARLTQEKSDEKSH